jgi:hypothetical protein
MKKFIRLLELIELLERGKQRIVDQVLSILTILRNDQGIAREPVMNRLEEV